MDVHNILAKIKKKKISSQFIYFIDDVHIYLTIINKCIYQCQCPIILKSAVLMRLCPSMSEPVLHS